jgi:hypothetical protein
MKIADWIQLALLVAVIAYTVETHRLRVQSERQLRLLRHQARVAALPSIAAQVHPVVEEAVISVLGSWRIPESERAKYVALAQARRRHYTCDVKNGRDTVAHNVTVAIYDAEARAYEWAGHSAALLEGGSQEVFWFVAAPLAYEEFATSIRSAYGQSGDFTIQHIAQGDASFAAVFFYDVEQRLYLTKHPFSVVEGLMVAHRRSSLYYDKEALLREGRESEV